MKSCRSRNHNNNTLIRANVREIDKVSCDGFRETHIPWWTLQCSVSIVGKIDLRPPLTTIFKARALAMATVTAILEKTGCVHLARSVHEQLHQRCNIVARARVFSNLLKIGGLSAYI